MIEMEVPKATLIQNKFDTEPHKWVKINITDEMRVPARMNDTDIFYKFIEDLYQQGGWPRTEIENYSKNDTMEAEKTRNQVIASRIDLVNKTKIQNNRIRSIMTRLKNFIGKDDFNLIYNLLKLIDEDFFNIVFPDGWNADTIENAHNAINAFSNMMESAE